MAAVPELSGKLVVLGFPHQEHGEEVGAYVEGDRFDERVRVDAARGASRRCRWPSVRRWCCHGAAPIPRTHTGKIQRRKMQPWFARWEGHRGMVIVEGVEG